MAFMLARTQPASWERGTHVSRHHPRLATVAATPRSNTFMHIHVINLSQSQGGEEKICMHERIVIVAVTLRNCCTLHKRRQKMQKPSPIRSSTNWLPFRIRSAHLSQSGAVPDIAAMQVRDIQSNPHIFGCDFSRWYFNQFTC